MSTLPIDDPQKPQVPADDLRNAHPFRTHRPDQPPQREGQPLAKIAATQDAARSAAEED